MKFLVDNQLPRALARLLVELGHDAVHVLEIELGQSDDRAIWAYATEQGMLLFRKTPTSPTLLCSTRIEFR